MQPSSSDRKRLVRFISTGSEVLCQISRAHRRCRLETDCSRRASSAASSKRKRSRTNRCVVPFLLAWHSKKAGLFSLFRACPGAHGPSHTMRFAGSLLLFQHRRSGAGKRDGARQAAQSAVVELARTARAPCHACARLGPAWCVLVGWVGRGGAGWGMSLSSACFLRLCTLLLSASIDGLPATYVLNVC